jgi:hypothetical protein
MAARDQHVSDPIRHVWRRKSGVCCGRPRSRPGCQLRLRTETTAILATDRPEMPLGIVPGQVSGGCGIRNPRGREPNLLSKSASSCSGLSAGHASSSMRTVVCTIAALIRRWLRRSVALASNQVQYSLLHRRPEVAQCRPAATESYAGTGRSNHKPLATPHVITPTPAAEPRPHCAPAALPRSSTTSLVGHLRRRPRGTGACPWSLSGNGRQVPRQWGNVRPHSPDPGYDLWSASGPKVTLDTYRMGSVPKSDVDSDAGPKRVRPPVCCRATRHSAVRLRSPRHKQRNPQWSGGRRLFQIPAG